MSRNRYIAIARTLHWFLAIGIIGEIILGLYGHELPYSAGAAAAQAVLIYAIHKSVGVALLAIAIVFALWLQLAPRRLKPEGRVGWDHALGRLVYFGLLVGMLAIPVTGPILHGNGPSWGYAPILWPWKDRIPGIPDAFATSKIVSDFHVDAWWVFAGLSIIHVLLWVRRRSLRWRFGVASHPASVTVSARLMRLAPVGGVLLWLALVMLVA